MLQAARLRVKLRWRIYWPAKWNARLFQGMNWKEDIWTHHAFLPSSIGWKDEQRYLWNFFRGIDLLISKRISVVIEAAFQHKLLAPQLSKFLSKTETRIIICKIPLELARERFYNRLLDQPKEKNIMVIQQLIILFYWLKSMKW